MPTGGSLKSRQDRALLATFNSQVEFHQDLTDRLDLLTQSIDKVKAQGGAGMYDVIFGFIRDFIRSSPKNLSLHIPFDILGRIAVLCFLVILGKMAFPGET